MTELERQLTEALKRLSAQYEKEQRRQSGQVEALRRQVERLSERVTDLTEYYETVRRRAARRVEVTRLRRVARPLDLTPPRGPERDSGPSR